MSCITFWRFFFVLIISFLAALASFGQGPDCVDALVICSDGDVGFNPQGPGIDDFADPDNSNGCLADSPIAENQSAWYYFEFQPTMPPNSVITFTIHPDAGASQDYDFAVFGPDVECDALGNPIRCSYSGQGGDTGLTVGAGDNSEGAGGDRFVNAITVQPGQGFYLVVDNFSDNSTGFSMSWGESAAPYLNCDATPGCALEVTTNGPFQICPGSNVLNLSASVTGNIGPMTYSWVASDGGNYLDNPTSLNPVATFPDGFSGDVSFTFTVTDSDCQESATIDVSTYPPIGLVDREYDFCNGEEVTISIPGTFQSYQWSTGESTPSIVVDASGVYTLSVIDENGCNGVVNFNITEYPPLNPKIEGDSIVCLGASATLGLTETYFAYDWSTGAISPEITVTDPGIYTVTVHNESDCFAIASWYVDSIAFPPLAVDGPVGLCPGESGILSTESGFSGYEWSNSSQNSTSVIVGGGNYTVTATDVNGCWHLGNIDVDVFESPQPVIGGDSSFCSGDSATLGLTGVDSLSNYLWSTGESSLGITVSAGGVYSITVENQIGCKAFDSVSLVEHPVPVFDFEGNLTICPVGQTTLAPDTTYNAYAWSTGATTHDIIVTAPGDYSLTVTDANGCSSTETATVIEVPMIDITLVGENEICTDESTEIGVVGDFAAYQWSTGEVSPTISVSNSGEVFVTVSDSNGCMGEGSILINVLAPPSVAIVGDNEFCEGNTTILSTNPSYNDYLWSSGSTQASDTISTPGIVSVTITDAQGCKNSANLTVVENPNPEPEILGALQFCPGTSTDLGLSSLYSSYLWSTGEDTPTQLVTTPGGISVTVTDENGCLGETAVMVENYSVAPPIIDGETLFCPDGSTSLSVLQEYDTYQWSTGAVSAQIIADAIGDVSVTVTDGNGCITSSSTTLSNYSVAVPEITGDTEFCAGLSAAIEGESGFATYLWSNNATTSMTEVTAGGVYSLTVTDNNGCSSVNDIIVTEHPVPDFTIDGLRQFCLGFSTELTVDNGYPDILWSTGESGSTIMVNEPGIYQVSVTDEFGCKGEDAIMVEELQSLNPEILGNLSFCINESTELMAAGSFSSYQWSNNQNTPEITVDAPGTYSLTVTDESGCVGETSVEVVEHSLPEFNIIGDSGFCPGEHAVIQGDAGFLSYIWSTGDTTPSISVNEVGDYQLTVMDVNGCEGEASISITENPLPQFSIQGNDFFCENGSTTLSVPQNFTSYQWSTGDTLTSSIVNSPGEVSVIVTNNYGCQSEKEIIVSEIQFPDFDAGDTGVLDCDTRAVSIGGDYTSIPGNWIFVWSGLGLDSSQINWHNPIVETEGAYELSLIDELHQCVTPSSTVEVEDRAYIPEIVLQVLDTLDCQLQTVRISANGSQSGEGVHYRWYREDVLIPDENYPFIYVTEPGIYSFEVLDDLTHCSAIDEIEVIEDHTFPIADAGAPKHLDCNITNVALDGEDSQAGPSITYEWHILGQGNITSGSNTNMPIVDNPGIYEIVVIDTLNGCSNSDTVVVTQDITLPTVDAGDDQTIDCQSTEVQLAGSFDVSGQDYVLNWLAPGSQEVIGQTLQLTVSQPGIYQLEVANLENGCKGKDEVEVDIIDNAPKQMSVRKQDNSCYQTNDAYIVINATTGGTPPFLYSLNGDDFSNQSIFSDLEAGSFSLQVEDANGCKLDTTITIREGNDLAVELGDDLFIDFGESVEIEAQISPSEDSLVSLVWNVQDSINCFDYLCTSFEATPLLTSTYHVTIRDTNGCVREDDITVFVNKPRDVYIPNGFSPNGDGINDRLMVYSGRHVAYVKSFLIFNRWGETVFEVYDFPPNDPTYGWDGTYRSQIYNPQVFTYFAQVVFIDGEEKLFKGDVTLVK